MSKAHTEIAEKLVSLLRTLPKDRISHYASFKETQLTRFQNKDTLAAISENDLKLQYVSLRDLVNDKYKNYYKLDDKMMRPKGNPDYYERLLRELRGESKESFFTALKTILRRK